MSEIRTKIDKLIKIYKSWYGKDVKVVMNQTVYDELIKDGISDLKTSLGCEYVINDKIATDFYVTHKLPEE